MNFTEYELYFNKAAKNRLFMKLGKTKYYKTDCKYETINNLCWFWTL